MGFGLLGIGYRVLGFTFVCAEVWALGFGTSGFGLWPVPGVYILKGPRSSLATM